MEKGMLRLKAIITDFDQTLLHTDKTLSAYTIGILQQCRGRGMALMAATARPERSILAYLGQIGFDAVTTLNGSRILLPGHVLEHGIPHQSAAAILQQLVTIPDLLLSVETSEGIYSSAAVPEWHSQIFDGFPALPTQGTLYKILVSRSDGLPPGPLDRVLTDNTYATVANRQLVQIMSKQATKWNGILEMLQWFSISPQEAVYFGDDNDDVEPIQKCGTGVAVSNAIQAVIATAGFVTGSNDEDGVAHFLEQHVLR